MRVIQGSLLHNDLVAAGIPIAGCAPTVYEPNKEVQYRVSYIPYSDRYARIDWGSEPSQEQKAKAAEIVAHHARVEPIDLNAIVDAGNGFPGEQQEKAAFIKTSPNSNKFSPQEVLETLLWALSQGIKPIQDTSLWNLGLPSFVQTSDNVIQSVVKILKNQDALELFDGGYIFFGSSIRSVNFDELAHWLLSQTILYGPQEAVNRLDRFLRLEAIPILRVLGICGVNLKHEIQLDDDIKLLPFSNIPNSATKEWILNPQNNWFFRSPNRAIPTAALTIAIPVKPKMANSFSGRLIQDLEIQKNAQLYEILPCLTLVGPSAPVAICTYDHVPEWIPFASQLQGMGSYTHEIDPIVDSILPTINSIEAVNLIKSYLELHKSIRERLRLPIERLNLAILRRNDADSAIELGIALEALLTHDRDGNAPLSFLICLRGSLLLGGASSEKQDNYNLLNAVYALRNKAAHTGSVDETSKVGRGDIKKSLPTNYLIQDGIELCANLIKRVILKGGFPDWQDLILNTE